MHKFNENDSFGGFERARPGGWSRKATRKQVQAKGENYHHVQRRSANAYGSLKRKPV